jgi:hypothetical protein
VGTAGGEGGGAVEVEWGYSTAGSSFCPCVHSAANQLASK